jgi:sec-independent protein translocase protein TatA
MPFGIGPAELLIVLVLALIILGPKRLPEVGRSLGGGLREFRESTSIGKRDAHDASTVGHGDVATTRGDTRG